MFHDRILDCNLHLGDLSALVVASEDGKSILEADLQCDEKSYSLDRVVATVDVIAHEQVVRVGWLSTNFEELSKVMELAVDVSADGDRSTHLLDVGLINKDFFCLNRIQKLTDVQNVSFHINQPPTSRTFCEAQFAAQNALLGDVYRESCLTLGVELTFSQRALTCDSGSGLQESRMAICSSRCLMSFMLKLFLTSILIFLIITILEQDRSLIISFHM